jgi:ATP-dependent helicase YprA (DUF1998 family)
VIISTAAASGKSLGYLMPALTSVLAGDTVLYVTPTKALAADQLASIRALGLPGVQAATFDGDSTYAERAWARSHARYLLTTPDMLHRALLPGHARWSGFFSRLRFVVIDECHGYRGVFGSHVAHVLRRLRRVVAHHAPPGDQGSPPRPVFVLASATVGAPGVCARLLTGLDAEEVTEDGSPRGPLAFALWELPLTEADLDMFGPAARRCVEDLTQAGRLRRRETGWYSMRRDAARAVDLRGAGLSPIRVVEQATGRLVGTVDEPSAYLLVHEGAIYVHQGDSYLVTTLDLADQVALVEPGEPGYTTTAKTVTQVEVRGELRAMTWGSARVSFGDVQVTRQVTSFTSRDSTGAALGETPLDLPPRHLQTRAVWWTIPDEAAEALTAAGTDLAGAVHAAEHASIGLLPLFATCDRWDIGGVSAARHPATGQLTVFVYDGHDGGAGFAERGFGAAADWLRATRAAIASCDCEAGCPSCVQSPKCGNGNHPLSKRGAVALLDTLLAGAPA